MGIKPRKPNKQVVVNPVTLARDIKSLEDEVANAFVPGIEDYQVANMDETSILHVQRDVWRPQFASEYRLIPSSDLSVSDLEY